MKNLKSALCLPVILCWMTGWQTIGFAQAPVLTVQLANPQYSCNNSQYCLDVEFISDTPNKQLFGMNVRFFYDDALLELIGFSGFQTGYGGVAPNPPDVSTSGPAGPALFNFGGAAEFVNGAIQLVNTNAPPIFLDDSNWTRLFKICFLVDSDINQDTFCPAIVWDLELDPLNGGFLGGDDGVVMTIVDPDPNIESAPTSEHVVQYNWNYAGAGFPPFGEPEEETCLYINCSLPVSLLSFTGFATEIGNHLEWETTDEFNNAGFEIQRSLKGVEWDNLGFVKSPEHSLVKNYYSFIDTNPLRGKNLYRLKQVDVDANFKFSPIIIIESGVKKEVEDFILYPNPVNEGRLNIRFSSSNWAGSKVDLFSSLGYLLKQTVAEELIVRMDVDDLPPGFYFVRVTNGIEKVYQKIIIENQK